MTDYPRIDVTVDVVALADVEGEGYVLLVRRGNPPFAGQRALPGGYLEITEDLAPAAARELEEETGIAVPSEQLRQIGAYGAPDRDPRNRTVSVAFLAEIEPVEPRGGSDASDAEWVPLADALEGRPGEGGFAFDHEAILRDGVAASRWASVVSAHADPG